MKSDSSDHALSKVLKEWRVDSALPPRFQESVWRRIEQAETPSAPPFWSLVRQWVGTVLPRPAMTASYFALLLALGVTAGWAEARQQTALVKDQLGDRYIQVLDPYASARP